MPDPSMALRWANSSVAGVGAGSCFGLAISCFLAFDNKTTFRSAFPEIPDFLNLHNVALSDPVRLVINQLWNYQWGIAQQAYIRAGATSSALSALDSLKRMMMSEIRDDRILAFFDASFSGGHAVNPYRLKRDPATPGRWSVYVYDNNYPDNTGLSMVIDSATNTWSYNSPSMLNWGGTFNIFLMDPSSDYLVHPLEPQSSTSRFVPSSPSAQGEPLLQVFCSSTSSIRITDSLGRSIGYDDSLVFNAIPGALPTIPITGRFHPPTGYSFPRGRYFIAMSKFNASTSHFGFDDDSVFYVYNRTNATLLQHDRFSIQNGFSITNPDVTAKPGHITMLASQDSTHKLIELLDLSLSANDSLGVAADRQGNSGVKNFGTGKSYSLRLTFATSDTVLLFSHADVVLDSNSAHYIRPEWSNLTTQPVRILIDHGNNGTIDDSIFVVNQPTGVDEQRTGVPKEFSLAQNYPNPFNPATTIRFALPVDAHISLKVYDLLGREVATISEGFHLAGSYKAEWNGRDKSGMPVGSGVYFYRLQAGTFVGVRKMLLLK